MLKKVIWVTPSNEDQQEELRHAPLGDVILAFAYPVAARRVSSTFFCPAMRIVAIDEKKRLAVFDQIVQPSRFVVLPATRLVLQMDPSIDYLDRLTGILAQMNGEIESSRGEIETEVSASALVFALFADALADLRRVKSVCIVRGEVDAEKLKQKFAPWERGQIVGSAGFIIDYLASVTWRIPDGAVELAHEILQIEKDYHDELMAASAAGSPWRLERPENAVPLCRDCAETLRFAADDGTRRQLVWALWGARFDALERWYKAAQNLGGYRLPKDWEREQFPLWPREFGGNDWASGSGATKHCGPRDPQTVRRTSKQQKILTKMLSKRR